MNGARAEPAVRTIKRPRSAHNIMIGASHHFFLTFRKSQKSAANRSFSFKDFNRLIVSSIELELLAPVLLLPERRLVLLVQKIGPCDQVFHLVPHEASVGVARC